MGERLVMRPVARADLAALVALANDREVAQYTARLPHPLTRADMERWFDALVPGGTNAGEVVFAIERVADGVVLGVIGLILPSADEPAEMGYWLGRRYWNRGYMTEAAGLLLRHAFRDLGLDRVRAGAFPGNAASVRVQEKLGMRRVAHEVRPAPARGGARTVEVYELSRAQWVG